MNNLDAQYQLLLKTILDFGVEKSDRTGTGTKSIFGYTIRHNMQDGFPLLTTKKMAWKSIVTELLWFLKGDTNIRYLLENDCHIWDGDAFANFMNKSEGDPDLIWNQAQFINLIKEDDGFASQWGDLGPIYGSQWRSWGTYYGIDQIAELIKQIKTNPDSRRLLVTAWDPSVINEMVLPPCHYGFQIWTRELSFEERIKWVMKNTDVEMENLAITERAMDSSTPTRAISLMWNQRSVDSFLGLPFNIASYGLLLEIFAREVNMMPEHLIGNLGDTHLYLNHIEQATEQISREPYHLPALILPETVEQMDELKPVDFQIVNYKSHPKIKAPLSN